MQATARFTALHYRFIACYAVSGIIQRCYSRAREFSLNISYFGFNKRTESWSECASDRRRQNIVRRGSLSIFLFTKYFAAEQIKKDDLAGACRRHGRCEKCIENLTANLKGKDHLGESGAVWGIIKKLILTEYGVRM